ncbi:hypothetical protein [Burkholderia sp. Ac-20344]|uniref:hypothetical protein n=1 Tax=Burkholderia sp. Ac-20344 TaxID=2703890 RepID=UPI00197B0EBA|nr:hypothetical protein [Burkholderia sp. Ac-20344]MBN3835951.1 hypothetical protein [Burkholderia sp. Ac-20344]
MNVHRGSRRRTTWIVGLLSAAVALAIADAGFVAYGLIHAVWFPATDSALATVLRETPDYLVLAVLLLAGLVPSIVDLVKLARAPQTRR